MSVPAAAPAGGETGSKLAATQASRPAGQQAVCRQSAASAASACLEVMPGVRQGICQAVRLVHNAPLVGPVLQQRKRSGSAVLQRQTLPVCFCCPILLAQQLPAYNRPAAEHAAAGCRQQPSHPQQPTHPLHPHPATLNILTNMCAWGFRYSQTAVLLGVGGSSCHISTWFPLLVVAAGGGRGGSIATSCSRQPKLAHPAAPCTARSAQRA